MTIVSFWQDGRDDPRSRIVLVRNSEADLLCLHLEEGNFKEVEVAFKVLENGYDFEDVFLDYLALKCLSEAELKVHSWKSIQLKLWVAAQNSLEGFDVKSYRALITEYEKIAPPLFRDTRRLIELLDEIADKLIFPYASLSFYDELETKFWNPAWWKNVPSWTNRLIKLQKKIGSFPTLSLAPPLLNKVAQILRYLQNINGRLEDDLHLASVLCFNAARINRKIGNINVALLLLHRSLDFFLLAECVSNNLVTQSAEGEFSYRDTINRAEKISIINSLNCLVSNGVLTENESRNYQIRRFNNARNMLIYTHGIYSIMQIEVDSFFQHIQDHIKSIDAGTEKWKKMLIEFNLFISIPTSTIFDIEDSFDTFVVKIFERT